MILQARYVVPVVGPVIENGAIEVRDGRIAAVGRADVLHGQRRTDFGDAVILPGFVNAHTHLELSALAGRVPPSPEFTEWLLRLVQERRRRLVTRQEIEQSVRLGVQQSLQAGVTAVGDITASPSWSRAVLAESPLRGVSFGEVKTAGRFRESFDAQMDDAMDHRALALPARNRLGRITPGISPHAPYTIDPQAMKICARRAADSGLPVCIHLAETADEERFTRYGDGPFFALFRSLNLEVGPSDGQLSQLFKPNDPPGCSPVELAHRTGLLTPRTFVAHANYVSDADIRLLDESGASVAYCPRTHDAFGHPPHRFRDMLAAGINVCVGTDSLASNPSLSVLDELCFLRHRFPDLASETILAMGTWNAAKALGLENEAGSLALGKLADVVVIARPHTSTGDAWEVIFDTPQSPQAVYLAGTPVPIR